MGFMALAGGFAEVNSRESEWQASGAPFRPGAVIMLPVLKMLAGNDKRRSMFLGDVCASNLG
jgi:hypothetical protein